MTRRSSLISLVLVVNILAAPAALAAGFDKELGRAIANDDIDAVKRALDAGADANAVNNEGETLLMVAALEGRLGIVKLLVERGSRVNAEDTLGATPLLYAAEGGSLDVIRFLIDKGADISASTRTGDTALSISEAKGNREAADLLRKSGVRKQGRD